MSLLFKHTFETRLAPRVFNLQMNESTLKEAMAQITKVCKMYDPKNEAILYRLPKAELTLLGLIPCPVSKSDSKLVNSSKAIRNIIGETAMFVRSILGSIFMKFREPPKPSIMQQVSSARLGFPCPGLPFSHQLFDDFSCTLFLRTVSACSLLNLLRASAF